MLLWGFHVFEIKFVYFFVKILNVIAFENLLCISWECFHNLTIPIYFPVCKEPEIPLNGSLLYSEDKLSVTYSCDVGFSASGTTDQTCQPEGPGWTDTPPTCGIYKFLFENRGVWRGRGGASDSESRGPG